MPFSLEHTILIFQKSQYPKRLYSITVVIMYSIVDFEPTIALYRICIFISQEQEDKLKAAFAAPDVKA